MREKLIHVKLSGDGTNIGKRLHVIAFTFTLLDEDHATSAAGNHILAVFKDIFGKSCMHAMPYYVKVDNYGVYCYKYVLFKFIHTLDLTSLHDCEK